jgi:putative ABC transport system ATP-binding protein
MTLIAENISKKFGQNGLAPVSMSIAENQFHVVIGESGCGKTTLLNILTGMLSPDSGSVTIDGKNIFTDMKESERTLLRYEKISYMTQGSTLIPELTVWQNIICPLELSGRKANEKDVNALAKKLGIVNILDSFPSEISGGEYRRVLLARCILPDAKLLLVDEPTSNLDEESAAIVREILFEEYKKGKGLLIVTHDRELLSYQPQIHELQAMKG